MRPSPLLLLLIVLASVLVARPAHASDQVVTVCDEIRFTNALNAIQSDLAPEGTITFDCGISPQTIDFSTAKSIIGRITIDGGGTVVLSGARGTRLFDVRPDASLTLRNIIIEKGNAGDAYGGAIEVNQNANLALRDSTIRQSRSNYSGGAIHSNQGNVFIEASILEDNTAAYGGAIAQDGGTLVISGTRVLRNSASVGDGGGVQSWFATNSFTLLQLLDNSAANSNGGGVSLRGGVTTMQYVAAGGNSAQTSGGGIYQWEGARLSATGLLLSQNNASDSGGGLYADNSSLSVSHSNLYGNTATMIGGGLVTLNSQAQVSDSNLFANRARSGGGIFHSLGALELTRSIVQLNSATDGDGGGIRSAGVLTMTNLVLAQNSATQSGGALRVAGRSALLINSTVYNNSGNGISARTVLDGRVLLQNSLLARNLPDNCTGDITSVGNGYNLADDSSCSALNGANDQKNTAVAFDEITVEFATIETTLPVPQAGSAALNTIPASQCPSSDLRGLARPQGSACDAGALERLEAAVRTYQIYLPFITR